MTAHVVEVDHSRAAAAPLPTPQLSDRWRHRLWLSVVCAALTVGAFLQQPGRISPDTKLDLTQDPGGFLDRALHLWDPQGYFGQVQNQAYGYLFPMGPFFAVGHALGVPSWATQRLWWSVLLCVAFLGTVRLSRHLGVDDPWARIAGGLAYALAPRLMSVLGAASVEALPMALLPWVMVPLLAGTVRGSVRRAAAWSGIAFFCIGAVNAAATLAVLPVPVLYLITRRGSLRLAGWWCLSVLLAGAWWVSCLLILGRISPPFLDYIETARTTTATTDLLSTLRGTDHWLGWFRLDGRTAWPGGFALSTRPLLVIETAALAGFGLVGVTRAPARVRGWLVLCVLVGVGLVTFGHVGDLSAPWVVTERSWLDGWAAPFRNVHKFDPVLRLPLAVGVAVSTAGLGRLLSRLRPDLGRLAAVIAIVMTAASGAVVLTGDVVPPGSFVDLPGYWQDTARWLAAQPDRGRALLVPGTRFGTYYWGSPHDEPMQALASTPWGVRDAVPLAPAGNIRYLDGVARALASGYGDPGLADYLARGGVHWLVVRNDIDYAGADATRPALVHDALARSGGIEKVADFGPTVGGASPFGVDVDSGVEVAYPAVEVFEVQTGTATVALQPLAKTPLVTGGPESLLGLDAATGLAGSAVLQGDARAGVTYGPLVQTDGLRRREVDFGRSLDNASNVLPASTPWRLGAVRHDYLPWAGTGLQTVAEVTGVAGIAASSSAADADALPVQPEHQPWAAVDGDPSTSWWSNAQQHEDGQWLDVALTGRVSLGHVDVLVDRRALGAPVPRLRVRTDTSSTTVPVTPGRRQRVELDPRPTSHVRLEVVGVPAAARGSAGLTEVDIPGVTPRRELRLPVAPRRPADAVVLTAADDLREPCVRQAGATRCNPGLARVGEESDGVLRRFDAPAATGYTVDTIVLPRAGSALSSALTGNAFPRLTATSTETSDPQSSAAAVADGDLGTGWRAAPNDRSPTLTVDLARPATVDRLRARVDPSLAASRPTSVTVRAGDEVRTAALAPDGTARFPAVTGRRLLVSFPGVALGERYDPYQRRLEIEPVGVSELELAPVPRRPLDDVDFSALTACGAGPDVVVDGRTLRTRVAADAADVAAMREVHAVPCGPGASTVDLVGDRHEVTVRSTSLWSVRDVVLDHDGTPAAAPAAAAPVVASWGSTRRVLQVPERSGPSLLVVRESTNPGWQASVAGHRLQPQVVDGWQQGWVVPAGPAQTVTLSYAPAGGYRLGLLLGAFGVLALVGSAVLGRRRPRTPPPGVAEPRALAPALLVVAAVVLVHTAGAVGVGALVLAVLAVRRQPGRRLATGGVVAGSAVLLAGLLAVAGGPLSFGSGGNVASQAASSAALALAAVLVAAEPAGRRSDRRARRRAGRSTA